MKAEKCICRAPSASGTATNLPHSIEIPPTKYCKLQKLKVKMKLCFWLCVICSCHFSAAILWKISTYFLFSIKERKAVCLGSLCCYEKLCNSCQRKFPHQCVFRSTVRRRRPPRDMNNWAVQKNAAIKLLLTNVSDLHRHRLLLFMPAAAAKRHLIVLYVQSDIWLSGWKIHLHIHSDFRSHETKNIFCWRSILTMPSWSCNSRWN